jgi:hypothetical protein
MKTYVNNIWEEKLKLCPRVPWKTKALATLVPCQGFPDRNIGLEDLQVFQLGLSYNDTNPRHIMQSLLAHYMFTTCLSLL